MIRYNESDEVAVDAVQDAALAEGVGARSPQDLSVFINEKNSAMVLMPMAEFVFNRFSLLHKSHEVA